MANYGYRTFEEQKSDLKEQISRMKSYVAAQELLPAEKRQIHLSNIVGHLKGSEAALSNLEEYLRRPREELEAEALEELDAAIRDWVELDDRFPHVSRNAIYEAKKRVSKLEKKIDNIRLLK
jgi:uncharacterized protein YicC (UPF0701 family)